MAQWQRLLVMEWGEASGCKSLGTDGWLLRIISILSWGLLALCVHRPISGHIPNSQHGVPGQKGSPVLIHQVIYSATRKSAPPSCEAQSQVLRGQGGTVQMLPLPSKYCTFQQEKQKIWRNKLQWRVVKRALRWASSWVPPHLCWEVLERPGEGSLHP